MWTAKYTPIILNNNSRYFDADTLSGRGVLIPSYIFNEIGLFDEDLPQYSADYEYFIRAKKRNIKLLIDSESIVYTYPDDSEIKNSNASLKEILFSI